MNSKEFVDMMIEKRGWAGGANLTGVGVRQLIEFCHSKGYNQGVSDGVAKTVKAADTINNTSGNDFMDMFKGMFNEKGYKK